MLGLVRSDAAALGVAQSYASPAKQSMEQMPVSPANPGTSSARSRSIYQGYVHTA